jgi:tetratricopeptide (TPR) repeat protein
LASFVGFAIVDAAHDRLPPAYSREQCSQFGECAHPSQHKGSQINQKCRSVTLDPTDTPTPLHTPTPGPTATATPKPAAKADPDKAKQLVDTAHQLFLKSDLTGAEGKLIEAIAADPTSLAAQLQLTEVYLYWPHYWRQALVSAEAATKLAPEDATALAYLSWAQQGAHHFDDAKKTALHAVELGPENALAHTALADVLSSVYEIDDAYSHAKKAAELDDKSANVWSTLGSIATTLAYPDEAGEAYDKAVELEPNFFAWRVLQARHELEISGDSEVALELAAPAIKVQPDHPFVLSFLVDVALDKNDFSAAEDTCNKMLVYNQPATPYPDAYSCLAGVKLLAEDAKGADLFQSLAEAIAPPARRDISVIRMRLYNDQEACSKSRALAEGWLKERPYSVLAMRMIGASYLCEENFPKAQEYFKQALDRLPRSLADARLLAGAYARDKKAPEARAVLNKVKSFSADNPLYYQALYEMNLFIGQMADAIKAAQRWQVLRPNSTEAMTSLALAELFDGKIDAAQSYAQKAFDAGDKSSTVYTILGQAYSRQGKFEQAESYLLQALGLDENHFLAHNFLTQLYIFSGQCDKAETQIEWFKKNAKDNAESLKQYQEMLDACQKHAAEPTPDPTNALNDDAVLRAAEAALKSAGAESRDIRFTEQNNERSLFVAFTSDLDKDSKEFGELEHQLSIALSRLLPRVNSQPIGLILLSGSKEEPQNIIYIATRAARSWVNGDLSDDEFEKTWQKESAESLRKQK